MTQYLEPISIIGIFIAAFLLIKKDFFKSIYVLLVLSLLLHKELFSFYKWDLLPIRAFMFALLCYLVVTGVQKLFNRAERKSFYEPYFQSPVALIVLAFWLVCGASIYFTLNLKMSVLLFGFLTTVVLMFVYLTRLLSGNEPLVLKYTKFYIFLGFLLCLFTYVQIAIYQFTGKIIGALWNVPGSIPRVGATFWDVNHFGGFLAALLPVSCVLVLTETKIKSKTFYALTSAALLVTLLLTNSRTAWIMAFVSFVSFALMFLYRRFGKKGVLTLFAALALVTAVGLLAYSQKSSPFRAAVKQYFHYRLDSFDSHLLLINGTVEIFRSYPVLGGGYGGFFEHFNKTSVGPIFYGRDPAAFTTRVPAHTIWGELLSGTGIIGFSLFTLLCIVSIGFLIRKWSQSLTLRDSLIPSAMAAVLIGWLFAGIFYSYNTEFFWIIWALYISYGMSLSKEQNTLSSLVEFFASNKNLLKTLVLTISTVLIFWALGKNHLIPWDEAIYAKISKNMIETGDYLSLQWKQGKIWYEKPPLYMWLEAVSMLVFGFSSFAVRLPSALAGLFTVLLVFKIGEKFFNRTVGYIAALSLITTTHFLYYSRTGMLDVTATFFITLALYLYLLIKQNSAEKISKYYPFVLGLSIGLAVITKGVVGLAPLPILFLIEIFSTPRLKLNQIFFVSLGFLVSALPWHAYMYTIYGQPFLQNYIGYHVFDRATSVIEDKGNPIWWYLIILKVSMRIWFVSFIPAFVFAIYRVFKKDKNLLPFVVWFALILALFSFAKSKLVWYIIPLYPAAAIINGVFIDAAINKTLIFFKANLHAALKFFAIFSITIFSLTYLVLNSNLVYTSNLTGSQSRLMLKKEEVFGKEATVYLDRVELPLALYYLNGPFEIIDFSAKKAERVPDVSDDKDLILLTKKGRYSDQVPGYWYAPTIVAEDGDWILWFMPPRSTSVKP